MNTSMAAVVGNNREICKTKKLIIKICHASNIRNDDGGDDDVNEGDGGGIQYIFID